MWLARSGVLVLGLIQTLIVLTARSVLVDQDRHRHPTVRLLRRAARVARRAQH